MVPYLEAGATSLPVGSLCCLLGRQRGSGVRAPAGEAGQPGSPVLALPPISRVTRGETLKGDFQGC